MEILEKAYLETEYIIFLPKSEEKIVLRINEPPPTKWIQILQKKKFFSYFLFTPYNPCSALLPDFENDQKRRKLKNILQIHKVHFYLAESNPKEQIWKEKFFCLFNVEQEFMHKLAFLFSQNAYIFGTKDTHPKLVWTMPDERILKRIKNTV
jgi:hypothetical protein